MKFLAVTILLYGVGSRVIDYFFINEVINVVSDSVVMLDSINLDKFIEVKSSLDSIVLQNLDKKEVINNDFDIDFSNMCTQKNVCICACMLVTHALIIFFIKWN